MRRRLKQTESIQDRLRGFADDVRMRAETLPPGKERDDLMQKARQADTASNLQEWANSPGLLPPNQSKPA
jgi:hypothetical protein